MTPFDLYLYTLAVFGGCATSIIVFLVIGLIVFGFIDSYVKRYVEGMNR